MLLLRAIGSTERKANPLPQDPNWKKGARKKKGKVIYGKKCRNGK